MKRIRSNLSYANVMATVAVFLVLGGGAFAAGKLGKNAVKTKNIKNGAVTTNKLANGAVTSAKVPPIVLNHAADFANGWSDGSTAPGRVFKDVLGIVHLQGNIAGGTDNQTAFVLPSGFRPGTLRSYATTSGFAQECTLDIETNGEVSPSGCNNLFVSLNGIDFLAGK